MAILMVVIDGMENTDYRHFTSLRDFKASGYRNNTPNGLKTDSLNCIMTLLGVKKELIPSGRGYFEALAWNLNICDTDLIFRCNLIEVDEDNILTSSIKGGRIDEIITDDYYLKHMEKHKYLLIAKNSSHYFPITSTYPPHQNIGKKIEGILPSTNRKLEVLLRDLIYNKSIFPWGQSIKEKIPSFYELHKKTGAIVAKTEIAVGIGKAMDMFCPTLRNATADIDTDLSEKVKLALELTYKYDFVMLHINGTDESSHRKNKEEKEWFIKEINRKLISYLIKTTPQNIGVIVTADHETSSNTGRHINSDVCYYIIKENEDRECLKWLSQL